MQHCEPTTPRPRRRGMTRQLSRELNTVCFVQCQSGSFRGHVHRLIIRRGMSSSGKSSSYTGNVAARSDPADTRW